MSESNYSYIEATGGSPIYAWDKGIEFAENAVEQLKNISKLPFIHHHVAAMPDCHWGMGATVGSVIATKGAVMPAAVGVDIGCGMCAWRLSLRGDDLPEDLSVIRAEIERMVPHGRTDNGGLNDRGAWGGDVMPAFNCDAWNDLSPRYSEIIKKHPKAASRNNLRHMGTLGTGNHFIEVCLDEANNVWIVLHSGSRGAGNRIGTYFIDRAKREMEKYHIDGYLPDKNLSYLVEGTELFDDYMEAVEWAQEFAHMNRHSMMNSTLAAMQMHCPPFSVSEEAFDCHHNYVARENHFGANVLVTRKGAVRARVGDLGIIPGSMGTGSFIVRGRGNRDSFNSCSHGAGRRMSRGAAKKSITWEEHVAATAGVECRKDRDVIDESPAAYKDISAVIAAQEDLIEVVHTLRQVINVKG